MAGLSPPTVLWRALILPAQLMRGGPGGAFLFVLVLPGLIAFPPALLSVLVGTTPQAQGEGLADEIHQTTHLGVQVLC